MTRSSTNLIIPQEANLPVISTNQYGFGQYGFGEGFRFHYDPHTQQSEWSKKRYQNYHSNTYNADNGNDNNPFTDQPQPYSPIPVPVSDETTLSPFDRLAFATEISIRYHERRHSHYDNVFRLIMLSIILLSGFALVSGVDARAILGLSIMGLAAGTIIWNVTNLSRVHDVLRNEYLNLMEMIRMTPIPQARDLRMWKTLRMRIRGKEPPMYWAVANECYYDVARAWDMRPRKRERLPVMLRPFKNWVRF